MRGDRVELSRWKPPTCGWVKINIDGVSSRYEYWSAVGGVVRDSHGNWVEGCRRVLGKGSALNTEFLAILHKLELA